jgi:serine/threonine-protein kinase
MPRARVAAERALRLDPTLAESHVAMGVVATYADWNPHLALLFFQEALRLRPNDADTLHWYTNPLLWLDTRFKEALAHVQRAAQLSPVDPWIHCNTAWVTTLAATSKRPLTELATWWL